MYLNRGAENMCNQIEILYKKIGASNKYDKHSRSTQRFKKKKHLLKACKKKSLRARQFFYRICFKCPNIRRLIVSSRIIPCRGAHLFLSLFIVYTPMLNP